MEDTKNLSWGSCESPPRDRANGRRVMRWSIGWAVAMLIAAFSASSWGFGGGATALVTAALSTLMGLGTVRAYRRFLREADELRQKIEMEALALAMGVGVVGGLAYSQFVQSLELGEPRVAFVIAGMMIVYSMGVVSGRRRYA